ncbi:MAG TPA: hypothetical protein ENK52_01860 [Saprospiraceae bacterium]|nr:hypothetical protein [Saprospiraceae bacterium]
MKTLNLSCIIIFSISLIFIQCKTTTQLVNEEAFQLTYNSPTEKITIKDNIFYHQHTQHHFAPQSVSSIPDSSSTSIIHQATEIPKTEISILKDMIHNNHFYKLKDAYGASSSERYYPYSLNISEGKKSKTVIFRSNPDKEKAPKAFTEIQNKILQLSKKLK